MMEIKPYNIPTSNMMNATKDNPLRIHPLVLYLAKATISAESPIRPIPIKETHIFVILSIPISPIPRSLPYYTIRLLETKDDNDCFPTALVVFWLWVYMITNRTPYFFIINFINDSKLFAFIPLFFTVCTMSLTVDSVTLILAI